MIGQELLWHLAQQNGGMLKTADAIRAGVSKPTIAKFVEKNHFDRVMRGVYCSPDTWIDKMYILQMRWPGAIYSHDTALFLHGLTDRDPLSYTVTMKTGTNPTNLSQEGLKVFTVKNELMDLGITTAETPFYHEVKVYNLERTICDIVRSRSAMDAQIFQDALKNYAKMQGKDMLLLLEYARAFRIEKIMKQYMEVLIS